MKFSQPGPRRVHRKPLSLYSFALNSHKSILFRKFSKFIIFSLDVSDLPLPELGKMPFNDLYNDIIEKVFYIHVFQDFEPRITLLLVCRRWYIVATQFSVLWRSICVGQRTDIITNSARCSSINGLLNVIQRTAQTTFELRIGILSPPPNDNEIQLVQTSIDNQCISRCRLLELFISQRSDWSQEAPCMGDMISSANFDALEHLTWFDESKNKKYDTLGLLISRVGETALGLKSLKLGFGLYYFPVLPDAKPNHELNTRACSQTDTLEGTKQPGASRFWLLRCPSQVYKTNVLPLPLSRPSIDQPASLRHFFFTELPTQKPI